MTKKDEHLPHEVSAGGAFLSTLTRSLRLAVRRLAKSPGFTATAIVSLALGIGANTAIFSLVNAVLLRELPLRAPEELVEVYLSTPDFEYNVFSYPDFEDFRDGTEEVFSGVAATRFVLTQVVGDGKVETLTGEAVSGNYFEVLGIEAQIGRTLVPEDDVSPGAHPVVVLGHRYWQQRFGGDPSAIGGEIRLGGRAYTVIGVAPEDYPGSFRGLVPSIYAPMMMINELMPGDSDQLEARGSHSIFVKARRRPGIALVQAQASADAVASYLGEQDLQNWDPAGRFLLLPRDEVILFPPIDRFIRAASWLLMVVVGLVLVLACINLASFLLARSISPSGWPSVPSAAGRVLTDRLMERLERVPGVMPTMPTAQPSIPASSRPPGCASSKAGRSTTPTVPTPRPWPSSARRWRGSSGPTAIPWDR